MTLYEQACQGTPGASATTAGTGYSLVNPSGTPAVTYDDTVPNPCHGGTTLRFDGTLETAAEVRWTPPATTTAAQSVTVMFTQKPAAGGGVLDFLYNRGTVRNNHVRLMESTDGRMRLYRRDSSTAGQIASGDLTSLLGVWLVVDLVTVQGTTANSGTMRFRVRRLDDLTGTPVAEHVATDVDTGLVGTHVMDLFQLGKTSPSSGTVAPFYVADHRLDDTATTYLPDPPVHVDEPAPDQAVVTIGGAWVSAVPHVTRGGAWEPVTLA